jgi:osmotically-inducible protein OsmY
MRKSSYLRFSIVSTALTAGMLLVGLLCACGQATREADPSLMEQTPSGQMVPSAASQFLGSDAALLRPAGEGRAAYLYISPTAQWNNYSAILLKPVEFWDAMDSSLSVNDQQMLASYFYNDLKENLRRNFTLVDQPGPGVMTMRAALINASAATPGLRSISVLVPQARILNYAQSLDTGQAAFAGSAEAALKVTDSTTGQLLAESVDKRVGGMALSAADQIQWGDAEAAMNYWAKRIALRATELHTQYAAAGGAHRPHAIKVATVSRSRLRTRVVVDPPVHPVRLNRRVNAALRADRKLNGARAYTNSYGGVVLYGRVFDADDRRLAERTASDVRGVQYVVNNLQTTTGQWMEEQVRINNAFLQINSLQRVSARVIGRTAYLSGQVRNESEKARAAQLVSAVSHLEVVNLIWVVPGPIFSMAKSG